MLFGLYNLSGTFQGYINEFLQEYLDVLFTVYLNNVLIYIMKEKNHTNYVF